MYALGCHIFFYGGTLQNQNLQHLKSVRSPPGNASAAPATAAVRAAEAAMMQQYNDQHRKKSLLEQHLEQQKAATKSKKSDKRTKEAKGGSGDVGKGAGKSKAKGEKRPAEGPAEDDWPWRPFDREKDMNISSAPKTGQQLLKDAGALSSRFAGGAGRGKFL